MRKVTFCIFLVLVFSTACGDMVDVGLPESKATLEIGPTASPTSDWPAVTGPDPSYRISAFYHTWYLNPAFDGRWDHWNQNTLQPPLDISSDYYPVLGAYSSANPDVVAQHFAWMREAGIGVVIADWWGWGSPTDKAVPLVLDIADHYNLKVAFVIEHYDYRSAGSLISDIRHLKKLYGDHPAFFWTTETSLYSPDERKKGLFFMWGTTQSGEGKPVPFDYWRKALDTVHGDETGAIVLTDEYFSRYMVQSHFDGSYNYGVLDIDEVGYTYAHHLPSGAWYVPGINPGFSAWRIGYDPILDTPRRDGQTYIDRWESMFEVGIEPQMLVITTFNEWHEGTQIEPAQSGVTTPNGYEYLDYGDLGPYGYLRMTREWVDKFLSYEWPE